MKESTPQQKNIGLLHSISTFGVRIQRFILICIGILLGLAISEGFRAIAIADANKPVPAPSSYSRYQKLDLFARSLATIENYYIRPVDSERLIYSAIKGLVAELDPHSDFLTPQEAKLLHEDIEGSFGGVGMVVMMEKLANSQAVLTVQEVITGGPAAKAGIQVGDQILTIEGQPIEQFTDMRQAIINMRGAPGTVVNFSVQQKLGDSNTPSTVRNLKVIRATVDAPAIESHNLGDGLAWIKLRTFSEHSATELAEAITQLTKHKRNALRGIILDLRNNGGGLLEQAVEVVNLFIRKGVIVRTRGRQGQLLEERRASVGQTSNSLPLIVLVNRGSASASEIVAGALQDHRRALILGEKTYGKGSVQAPFELGDGSVLKLTIALYYTPDDRLIQASGIAPDIVVSSKGTIPSAKEQSANIEGEQNLPRHLKPEDFGYRTSPQIHRLANKMASNDVQLQAAIEHLYALIHLNKRKL